MERTFQEAVDDYLEYCAEIGRTPGKPFSGKLNVRLDADLQRKAHIATQRRKINLNKLIIEALGREIGGE